ncbi:MAG: hypothetical protein GX580_06935 [Candidatus Hydrogenedens sp.]|nr:hypothetical protein [Candidatus Hydrogenedentota bacterium]NLF57353.1 hypothetical protein [Candidatus Hydrogenedens sp.]
MDIRIFRMALVMTAAFTGMAVLSGCGVGTIKMKVVNNGDLPITGVQVYDPPAQGEVPGPDAEINRMPLDGAGYTRPIAVDDAAVLPWFFQNRVYRVSVTFFRQDPQGAPVFETVVAANDLDLRAVRRGSTVTVTVTRGANNPGTFTYQVQNP